MRSKDEKWLAHHDSQYQAGQVSVVRAQRFLRAIWHFAGTSQLLSALWLVMLSRVCLVQGTNRFLLAVTALLILFATSSSQLSSYHLLQGTARALKTLPAAQLKSAQTARASFISTSNLQARVAKVHVERTFQGAVDVLITVFTWAFMWACILLWTLLVIVHDYSSWWHCYSYSGP